MTREPRGDMIRQVHALFRMGTVAGLTDGELLDRFLNREGEVAELAFSLLVERHGPMVLGVCRRILGDPHAAQDAFQATFLVLVRKARAIRSRGSVASWLYGVAHRVSVTARSSAARRRMFCLDEFEPTRIDDTADALDRHELHDALHEELLRLPERYRAPLVLCYLEGLTHEQAALRLGRPLTTVRSWLVRGREQLRGRLSRRGVTLSVGLVATALTTNARAGVSPALVESTVRAVASFWRTRCLSAGLVSATSAAMTEGLLRTMFMTKLKIAVAMLSALSLAATGAGVLAYQAPASASVPADDESLPRKTAARYLNDDESLPEKTAAPYRTSGRVSQATAAPPTAAHAAAAADEYIAKTTKEVDASITALRAEVEQLSARLERAKSSLRRMEALKAALSGTEVSISFTRRQEPNAAASEAPIRTRDPRQNQPDAEKSELPVPNNR